MLHLAADFLPQGHGVIKALSFAIFIGFTNCGRQKLPAPLPLPAAPAPHGNDGTLYLCVTVEMSLLRLLGHREPGGSPEGCRANSALRAVAALSCFSFTRHRLAWEEGGRDSHNPCSASCNPLSQLLLQVRFLLWNCGMLGLFPPVGMCGISQMPGSGRSQEPGKTHRGHNDTPPPTNVAWVPASITFPFPGDKRRMGRCCCRG